MSNKSWTRLLILLAFCSLSLAAPRIPVGPRRSLVLPRQVNSTAGLECLKNRGKYSPIPSDIVIGNPKCSEDRRSCYRALTTNLKNGNTYMALDSSHPTVAVGPTGERSNSYADAYNICSAKCNEQGAGCKSFNIFTAPDDETEDCRPTWMCRTSSNFFTPGEYSTQGRWTYSQAFDVYAKCDHGIENADCSLAGNDQAWARCSVLGKGVEFAAKLAIARLWDGHSCPSAKVDKTVKTGCVLTGVNDMFSTIEYSFDGLSGHGGTDSC